MLEFVAGTILGLIIGTLILLLIEKIDKARWRE